jgi:hypothetical protein
MMDEESVGQAGIVVTEPVRDTPGESLVQAIVRSVSEVEGRPAEELPPLYSVIDPDALLTICGERAEKTRDGGCAVSFEYSDSSVLIERGVVTVTTPW